MRSKRLATLAAVLMLAPGCGMLDGPKARVLTGANRIDDLAGGIQADLAVARNAVQAGADGREVLAPIDSADRKAGEIKAATRSVRSQLPKLEETESKLWPLLKLAAIVALIVVVLIAMSRLGIDKVLKPIFAKLGLGISRLTKSEAKLDAEALANGEKGNPELQARVAIRRATDAGYDREFVRQKQRVAREQSPKVHANVPLPDGVAVPKVAPPPAAAPAATG